MTKPNTSTAELDLLLSGLLNGKYEGEDIPVRDENVVRSDGWSNAVPEPVVIELNSEDPSKNAIVMIADEADQKYLLFHDPENEGQFLAMTPSEAHKMYQDAVAGPIRDQISEYGKEHPQVYNEDKKMFEPPVLSEELQSLREAMNGYKTDVNLHVKANPSVVLSSANIEQSSLVKIHEYESAPTPVVERELVGTASALTRRGGGPVEDYQAPVLTEKSIRQPRQIESEALEPKDIVEAPIQPIQGIEPAAGIATPTNAAAEKAATNAANVLYPDGPSVDVDADTQKAERVHEDVKFGLEQFEQGLKQEGIVIEGMPQDVMDACSGLAAYGGISYALEAVAANYAGVVSGDYVDLKDVEINVDALPEHASAIKEQLEQIQAHLADRPELEKACYSADMAP